MKWTQQQQNAIDARDASFIVSAAAGSGKTAVLTERLVSLLSDPESGVRADRLIVVTFTNDAAAELKKRLDTKLRALITERPEDRYLLKQQTLLQSAKISTINSFCFDLLRDNITDQGITSGFSVLDDTDCDVIKAQAMDELFDWYSRNGYETVSYLYDKFCRRDHMPLAKVILSADRFLSSVAMRDKWLDTAVAEYKKDFESSVYSRMFFDSLKNDALLAVKLAEENFNMLGDIFSDSTPEPVKKSYVQAQYDLERANALLKLAESRKSPSAEEKEFISISDRLVSVRANTPHNAALREIFKARRTRIKDIIAQALGSLDSVRGDFDESGKTAELLAEMVRKFQEIVWEKKCARNAIGFDDGERLALELLADFDENGVLIQSETAKQTAEYYDMIMIDEYQDSNNKEDLIFKLLTKNFKHSADGMPMYGSNAFLVGDVKQSIYRFRLANPKNFISVMKHSEPFESDSENRYILLNKNFRSSRNVINFVNFVFGEIMSEKYGDIDYNDDEKLYFGAEIYDSAEDCDMQTEIRFINCDPPDEDDETEVLESPEAEATAEKIASMLSSEAAVVTADGKRPCRPSDFCVLVRNNRFSKAYVSALERRGIAVKGSEEKGYLRSPEIAVLINLLRVIANPLQDVPLASVMVSPMYAFSIREIAVIKSADNQKALYPLVTAYSENTDEPELAEKCRRFLETLGRFRLDAVTMTLGELISAIYDATDFISVMQLKSDGEKKRANLRALIQYAGNYEALAASDGGGGLTGFIRHIDRIMENGDYQQGKAAASSGDFVTVQTLHKSKGLEYPFVFIAETYTNFKFDSDTVMCSDDGRIGFVLYNKELMRRYKTFQQKMLKNESRRDSLSEEMRLLYVGMTRAKQKLFIDLNCGEKSLARVRSLADACVINGSSIADLAGDARCFADWIWLSLMMHADFPKAAEMLGISEEPFGFPAHDTEEELFNFEKVELDPADVFEKASVKRAEPDSSLVKKIRDIINAPYDDSLTEVTAKLSVTQITRKFSDDGQFDLKLARPRFISGIKKLTGAERGTAVHTFFQYCDFELAAADPITEIKRLTELGYLTEMQAESISADKVTAFFKSGLYSRIKSAKDCQREKKFMVSASELDVDIPEFDRVKRSNGMIKGIIDLVYEVEDGLVIVDYKSDRGASAEQLRERYTNQLRIYKSALELTTGLKVKGLELYSIELEREIPVTL